MPYGDKILDHYNNPRNMGSLSKSDVDVGTGMVGAPECFGPNTIIAVADGRVGVPIENLFSENTTVMVWAFNIQEKLFEIKMARVVFTGDKSIDSVTFDDGGTIEVTPDHEFLQRPNYEYVKNCVLQGSILPFRKIISERGYWFIKNSKYGEEYKSIYHFSNSTRCGSNVHHKDGNKQNDSIENLEELSAAEHRNIHQSDIEDERYARVADRLPHISQKMVQEALDTEYARPEAADRLAIHTDDIYALIQHFGIGVVKRKSKNEIRELSSLRMRNNNPYRSFTPHQKLMFASHPGPSNGRWTDVTNEELLAHGKKILDTYGKLTTYNWGKFAKENNLPIHVDARFGNFNNFAELSISYNHKIVSRRSGGIRPCYTLQVEELNNFVVLTSCSKNIRSGVVVKNCGDVMRLQVRVKDDVIVEAKFKTFGCGSAIASSSLATEWLKGKTVDEALTIKNTDIVTELNLPPQKIHCSVLTEDAIKAALYNYKKKQEGEK